MTPMSSPRPGFYPDLDAARFRAHETRLRRFAEWQDCHPASFSPAESIAAVAFLFELLPPASRARPVSADGVVALHRLLSSRRPRP